MGQRTRGGGGVIDDGAVKGPGGRGSLMMERSKDRGGGVIDDGTVKGPGGRGH